MKIDRRLFGVLAVLTLLIAVGYRFVDLGLKPYHHDECVNYVFVKKLVDKGVYEYNPTAYHGPLLFFATAPVAAVAGYTKATLRVAPAAAGVAVVLLALLFWPEIGRAGALFAAAALAVAPAEVYFDKTFIHEVFFNLGFVAALLAMFVTARNGRAWSVVFFYVALVFGFTVKETMAINGGVMILGLTAGWLASIGAPAEERLDFGPLLGHPDPHPVIWGVGIGVSFWIVMFTSFLTHPQGLVDFFKAYLPWLQTGVTQPTHVKTWDYFPRLLGEYYWPVLPFAAWGAIRAAWTRRPRLVTLAVVAVALLVVYSVIPYKTPWCILTIGAALALLAGAGLDDLLTLVPWRAGRFAVAVAVCGGLAAQGWWSDVVNFREYDFNHNVSAEMPRHDIVYVQTVREYEKLFDDLQKIAEISGKGKKIPIFVSGGAKNPGRFYLRDYRKVTVESANKPRPTRQDVVLVRTSEMDAYAEALGNNYRKFSEQPVFPGWQVNLMVREALWEKLARAGLVDTPNPS